MYGLAVCLLCLAAKLAVSEQTVDDTSTNSPLTTTPGPSERSGRKYFPQYEVPDRPMDEAGPFDFNHYGPQASARALPKGNYLPYRHAGSGVMKKSGTNVNWSVWKGDDAPDDDASDETESAKWPMPNPWASDPWAVDPTYLMMLKNAMADIKADTKPAGFLAKLGSDPALLLIAASIPISLLLAAVLPSIMNMLMNGNNVPLISTTATGNGNTARNQDHLDILPYLSPFMEAIGTFGVRSLGNPDCMQRIFCQVAEDKISSSKALYLKKALNIARFISDGNWLENFGVKELVDSLGSGKCEDIPCSSSKVDTSKSKYSRKMRQNKEKP